MKTLELVSVINEPEVKHLRKQLGEKKSNRTLVLFDTLYFNPDATKEELFIAVFRKKYSIEKDYLLRNELRLLNDELENFIASRQLLNEDNSFHKHYLLLKKLKNENRIKLFESEWSQCFKNAKEQQKELEQCLLLLLQKQ